MTDWALDDDSKIQLIPAGVGSSKSRAEMGNGIMGLGSERFDPNTLDSNSADAIDIVALDDMLKGENVRFIKADIEGFEMEMLRGAERIIREKKPVMAICLYHKLIDYYEIPLFIKSLVPEYKLRVRHHSTDFIETVLYCTL